MANNTLIEKMIKSGNLKGRGQVMGDSKFFEEKSYVPLNYPILNIAFSAKINGGLTSGLTVIAGESKTFKTLLGLLCLKAYLDEHDDGIAIIYDSEFGITNDYLVNIGIDVSRVVHIPIMNIEELKFDFTQKLNDIDKKDKVYFFVDSLGNLASKKEVEDAEEGKSVADMSRAKQIKSLFRIITPHFTIKDIPCVIINHTYKEQQGLYPRDVVSGGQGVMLSANTVFIITKAQQKEGKDLKGFKFTLNIEKSRFVKEKSKLPLTVLYDYGIQKWSGMFDLAEEAGFITNVSKGWYAIVDPETGEVDENKRREKSIAEDDVFNNKLINSKEFCEFIEKRYKLQSLNMSKEDEDEEDIDLENE